MHYRREFVGSVSDRGWTIRPNDSDGLSAGGGSYRCRLIALLHSSSEKGQKLGKCVARELSQGASVDAPDASFSGGEMGSVQARPKFAVLHFLSEDDGRTRALLALPTDDTSCDPLPPCPRGQFLLE